MERGAKGCQIFSGECYGGIISDVGNTGGKGVVERRKFVSGGALGQVRCV